MYKLIFLASLAAILSELVLANHLRNSLDWQTYKRRFTKSYETPEQDATHFANFLSSRNRILHHNADRSQASRYRLGLTSLSDKSFAEMTRRTGFNYDPKRSRQNDNEARIALKKLLEDTTPIPKAVDWRKVPNRVSGIKDQGECASCWAFAALGVLEAQELFQNISNATKEFVPLSEQNLIDCSYENDGCTGGHMADALRDVYLMYGVESQQSYPYQGKDLSCGYSRNKASMSCSGPMYLPANEEEVLKKVVALFGPVAVGVMATDAWQNYESGVFDEATCTNRLNHAVLVVGYGSDAKLGDYWILKNSWGIDWGEQGYIRVERGKGRCGIGLDGVAAHFEW